MPRQAPHLATLTAVGRIFLVPDIVPPGWLAPRAFGPHLGRASTMGGPWDQSNEFL